jgi:S-formylglutathione hydrolase FrmB
MKKILLTAILLLSTIALTAQINIISTSFYSQALDETKMVNVFLPPGYDANPDLHYPVIYFLHGWQGNQNSGNVIMNKAYTLISQGLIEPVIMVCAHNSPAPFSGSVYVNSILWGDYETYMVEDLCNWVESAYRAMPGKNYRGLFGFSMGGYGAFRYGILHNDKYGALASYAGAIHLLEETMSANFRQMILQGNQPGPPYTYNYNTGGVFTQLEFLFYGAFAPNYNTPQTYINPAIVEFPLDQNGNWIDTVQAKLIPHNPAHLISQLTPAQSPGIYFGCGANDDLFLNPGNLAMKDTLDLLGLPYIFYQGSGGHVLPDQFTTNALLFLDSLLMPPVIPCSCLPEGISFTSQWDIDNFQTNYPGCTEIEGDVAILGVENNIYNLQGLSLLTAIGGTLWINATYDLANLEGLNGIVSIGGDLVIGAASMAGSGNHILENFSGLNNLETIGGDFSVSFNPILINFQGLSSLVTVGGDFSVRYNPSLINLEGIESLISIGADLILESNESMTNLTGLDNLTSIGASLSISFNSALTSLTGMENIAVGSITNLGIQNNPSLSTCHVQSICDFLAAPNGEVIIDNNAPGCNSQAEVIAACETVGIDEAIAESGFSIYPNPFTGQLNIDFSLPQTSLVSIQIFNAMGAKVVKLHHGQLPAGQQQFGWDAGDLPKGIYLFRALVGNETFTQKIIKVQ